MKLTKFKKQAGLTLIEITLVIAVLLGLLSVLFIGVSAYREGSNRTKCILNIANVQKAMRSYVNLYEIAPTGSVAITDIAGTGKLMEAAPTCPSGGTYTYGAAPSAVGTAYATCSLSSSHDHVPNDTTGW